MISSSRPILRIYNSDDHEITWLFINLILLLLPFQFSPNATAQTIPDSPESYSFGPTISRNMTIVLVILVCFFIVLGSLSVYTRHCTENRFRGAIGISVPNANSRRADGIGLDATIINSFPTFVYSTVKALKIGKNSLECAVCLNEFVDDDRLRLLPKCNHVFHSDCIDTWLASHSTCPVCRANLFPKPGDLAFTLLRNSDRDSAEESEPDRGSEMIQPAENYDRQERNTEALDVNLINPIPGTNQNRPPRSRSTGWRFGGKFPRSHSTGHSLVQPGESYDRFTLRLPDEVRREILNSSLNRARSCVAFPRVQSSRQGYRGAKGGSGRGWGSFMAESGSNRWTSLLSTPFFGRNGSSRTQKEVACLEEDAGERLFVRLRADGNSQV